MNNLRSDILAAMAEAAQSRGAAVVGTMTDDTLLLESGLDSLGFAILVARLEETLGFDRFVKMSEPVYPRTLGEFVSIYERYAP